MKKFLLAALMAALCLTGAARPKPKHIVFIGVDGWSVAEFSPALMPFTASLKDAGAWTFDKRTVIPTSSGINWESLFTATPPEYHGYTKWNSTSPDYKQVTAQGRSDIPTIFRLLREKEPKAEIAAFYEWKHIKALVDSTAVNDLRFFEESIEGDNAEVEAACAYLKAKKPRLALFYFGTLDHMGHTYGWKSDEYRSYLTQIDKCIHGIFQGIKAAGLENDTLVVLTTDHGGNKKSHGGQWVDDVMRTPLFFVGKGARVGYELQGPSIEMDVPATIAWLLGIKPLDNWTGKALVEAFK